MFGVIDSSFTASIVLPDEANQESSVWASRIGDEGAAVPGLWQLEMTNLLLVAQRRKRITGAMLTQILGALDVLPIAVHSPLNPGQRGEIIQLAGKHGLTAYDAAYLELSVRLNLPLATLDNALKKAAKSEGVTVLP